LFTGLYSTLLDSMIVDFVSISIMTAQGKFKPALSPWGVWWVHSLQI